MKTAESLGFGLMPQEGVYLVTPQMANFWVNNCIYLKQRKVRRNWVKCLKNEMQRGRFREKTQLGFCELDGEYYLTNGQHTLLAIIEYGKPQLLDVVVLSVKNEKEIADDYSRWDTSLSRTLRDSLSCHDIHEELGISRTQLELAIRGALFYNAFTQEGKTKVNEKMTIDEKIDTFYKYKTLCLNALEIVKGYENFAYIKRRTTMAAIMLTINYDFDIAIDFWTPLLEDDGLKKHDPRKTLLDFFKTTQASVTTPTGKKSYPDIGFMKAISLAWSAYIEGRQISFIKSNPENWSSISFAKIGKFEMSCYG